MVEWSFQKSFNPAQAGNTLADGYTVEASVVQPRLRGEYCTYFCCNPGMHRSTPRRRGKLVTCDQCDRPDTFNPAQAGNTWEKCTRRSASSLNPEHAGNAEPRIRCLRRFHDQPRFHGEHSCGWTEAYHRSTPRKRGIPTNLVNAYGRRRSTPYRRGKHYPSAR